MFHADLHIHSRFSRACSRDCDIEHLAWWALRKGITVVGTGDFTHPGWAEELRKSLVPAEPGLLQLGSEAAARLRGTAPPGCSGEVRFMLSAEISTIYRRDERTRKVHHLLYAPSFEAAERITRALSKVGNLASDGRPILGLDSRDLLEITLESDPGCYLVPAHAWTPWFAVLGSKSGFDLVTDCYADLAGHVFAIETGLSSDPPMNWRCSSLDGYRLVSNSDAHSPPMLGREATTFDISLDYFAIAHALRTGDGLAGTIEFYPEEGKYHLDGHRKCGVRFEPGQSKQHKGTCPECAKPLTIGVLHRVMELADRPAGYRPPSAAGFCNLVQLPQIVGEIMTIGPKSKKVRAEVGRLVAALGPELRILTEADLGEVGRAGGSLLAEAVTRVRRGQVRREAGYDGEYGTVRLFAPGELDRADALFEVSRTAQPRARRQVKAAAAGDGTELAGHAEGAPPAYDSPPAEGAPPAYDSPRAEGAPAAVSWPGGAGQEQRPPGTRGRTLASAGVGRSLPDNLDPEQQVAAQADSPLMIIAGPGTGKTRVLTHRIAVQATSNGHRAALAITFTRRAAEEMRTRLDGLLGAPDPRNAAPDVTVTTFHQLGLMILRDHQHRAGLEAGFRVADDAIRLDVARQITGSAREGSRLLSQAAADPATRRRLVTALAARNLVDFDGLVELPTELMAADPELTQQLRQRWPCISVDEYQDIDLVQHRMLTLLAGEGRGLTVIGDPDQAIYGFRGADVNLFLRFGADYPGATIAQLTTNYRSTPAIVAAATAAVAPSSLVPGRVLRPAPALAASAAPRQTDASLTGRVGFHQAADEHAEAEWIAREIERLLGGASFHSLDTGRAGPNGHEGLALSSIAVLYRTIVQSEPLARALTRAGLPFQKCSHDRLERRTGVGEIVREMRFADSAASVADRLRLATATLAARAGTATLTGADGRTAALDVRTAGELLGPLARRCGDDLDRFLTEISLGAQADALDPRADAITLLTLHAAKGLEFEVVFLAGCEKDLLPLRLPGQAPLPGPAADEERRLLFVGVTRARARLYLSCAARRTRHGNSRETGPSVFLDAIGPALLDSSGNGSRPDRPTARQLRLL